MKTTFTLKQKLLEASQPSWWKFATSSNFLKLRTANLCVVLFLFTVVLMPAKSFAQIASGFELDGNAVASPTITGDDWDLIYNGTSSAQVTTGIDNDLSSSADNRFTVGSKDQGDINTWSYDIASVPDKNDILHAGAALYSSSKIFFFGDRFATSGDAQIGFWLFKNDVSTNTNGSFSGTHAIGDILLLSNFVNGGGVPQIVAYEWVGSGGSDGTLNLIPVSGTNLFAITNSVAATSPWPYKPKSGAPGSFPIGAFFEGGIDLAGLAGIDPCFSSFLIETRSSAAVNAELKDFLFGKFQTRPQVTVNSVANCIGNANAAVLTASVQGGVSPFTYSWSPGGTTTSSISVSPTVTTIYTVVVTGANGCAANPATGTVTINQLPSCSIGTINPPLAKVNCKLDASASGYTNTISTITNLDLNIYTLSWSVTPSQVGMTGWNIISNGTNTLTFQSGLCGSAGANIVVALTVTNKNTGCVSTCQQTITPTSPQCGITPNPHGSLDCNRRQDTLSAILNVDNPTILWTASAGGHIIGSVNTATAIVDQPGTYTITANDAVSGCNVSATYTVTQNITVPEIAETHTNVSCFGGNNGAIDITVTGGLPGYTYSWSNGSTTEDVSGLVAGSYTVTVTGANGCAANKIITITQPALLTVALSGGEITCFQPCVQIFANPSDTNVTYSWTGPKGFTSTIANPSVCDSGTYIITVTSQNNCISKDSAKVNLVVPHSDGCGSSGPIASGFELDGNAFAVLPNPPDDWDLIANGTSNALFSTGLVTDLPSKADNYFVQGSKDITDIPGLHYSIQTTPDKDDILHAGAAQYNTQLYFFGDRYAVNGNAQIGFWFYKNPVQVLPGGNFSGTHTVGDLLILSNFTNGGSVPDIFAYEWVGSGGTDGTLNKITLTAANSFATVNSVRVDSPWPYNPKSGPSGKFPPGAFFEGGIDLACLPNIDLCFASFLMETRSSAAVTAELKDFVEGNFTVNEAHLVSQRLINHFETTDNERPITISAYPNPFDYSATIEFNSKKDANVKVEIYSITGEKIATLFNEDVKAGETNKTVFKGDQLASGIYFYKIIAGNKIYIDKLILKK